MKDSALLNIWGFLKELLQTGVTCCNKVPTKFGPTIGMPPFLKLLQLSCRFGHSVTRLTEASVRVLTEFVKPSDA